ncbi:hypothetical protein Ngar_c15210 [Candidatus Nitrososphaera gargensis Ga9.2]|uniref:Uncharacterized protein n=1 Tax=Nitrososphaera gargensis (strain Ga9.2) TaxID=1237085 RepID=K0IF82_NITGG|nr:hypothetical protein Ngar_c15210 [Candidatus Nitrososphaera gargensis Ga9.2]
MPGLEFITNIAGFIRWRIQNCNYIMKYKTIIEFRNSKLYLYFKMIFQSSIDAAKS